jgi:hypothetical protein
VRPTRTRFDNISVYAVNSVTRASNEQVPELIATSMPPTGSTTTSPHTIDQVSSEPPQQTRDSVAIDHSKTAGGTFSDYTMRI